MDRFSCRRSRIEPLEDRIAPALLINGANLIGGPHSPSTGETSVGGNTVTIVKILSGQAIVWFEDGHIDGISFGNGASLVVTGNVNGNVVGNLGSDGRLSDSDHNPLNGEDGDVLLPNKLIGFKTMPLSSEPGDVGNIVTGGSVSNVSISGAISGIYAGDGVFNPASALLSQGRVLSALGPFDGHPGDLIDYNPIASGVQNAFVFTAAEAMKVDHAHGLTGMQSGASIHDLTISKAVDLQVFAGSGNPNQLDFSKTTAPVGGSVYNVAIQNAFVPSALVSSTPPPSYYLLAGAGGTGGSGGAGGSVYNVSEVSSSGAAIIHAGQGGNGLHGAGGAGGSVSDLNLQSASSQYTIVGGNGGTGAPGGAGGSVRNTSYANNNPAGGIIVAAPFTGHASGDVLVTDQGTGDFVIEQNNGNGTNFTPVQQYVDAGGPHTLVTPPVGAELPVAAAAVDFNLSGVSGQPDVIVAYQASDSLVVYENQGGGVFWNSAQKSYATISSSLTFSPSEMAVMDSAGDQIALAENIDGRSAIHLVTKSFSANAASLTEVPGSFPLPLPCTGLVATPDGTIFASLSNGSIYRLTVGIGTGGAPLVGAPTGLNIKGGITQLDVDSTGSHILALGNQGKVMEVFNEGQSAGGSGNLTLDATINLSNLGATAEVAHFFAGSGADRIAVLGSQPGGSQIEIYDPSQSTGANGSIINYTPEAPITTDHALRNFAIAFSSTHQPGLAGLETSLGQFAFDGSLSQNFTQYSLPFASKTVSVTAGNGGNGIDVAGRHGHGGLGGSVVGIDVLANQVNLTAGSGGSSHTGAGGNGGSVSNSGPITLPNHSAMPPNVGADSSMTIRAGAGGSATAAGTSLTTGGAGGSIQGLSVTLDAGTDAHLLSLIAGAGGNGMGGDGGAGGAVSGITADGQDGGFAVFSGNGGSARAGSNGTTGFGGNGGAVTGVNYTLALDSNVAAEEKTHSATIETGNGGNAISHAGGSGGALQNVVLVMQGANRTYTDKSTIPNLVDAHLDSTVTITVATGNGGSGRRGGSGGNVSGFAYSTTLNQSFLNGSVAANYAVLSLVTGSGGKGYLGTGGNGGNITLSKPISGITSFDPDAVTPAGNPNRIPLIVTAGSGGSGFTSGGTGGSISGLVARNSIFAGNEVIASTLLLGARVTAGAGGNGLHGSGGAGGAITNSTVGVQAADLEFYFDSVEDLRPDAGSSVQGGSLVVAAGNGGSGGLAGAAGAPGAVGGAGGYVSQCQFGLVSTAAPVGMIISGGAGGSGIVAGGGGGALVAIQLNMSQSTAVPSALLYAGAGGSADSASGVGGKGGGVHGIFEGKDENSSINLIQAGDGGSNRLGKGGAGGNVSDVQTVGFIGRPSNGSALLGVFDRINAASGTIVIPQGLFSGRGGAGVAHGANGSISDVVARQIAAMSAAEDPAHEIAGTAGTFAAASAIVNVTADVIGYDANANGKYDNVPGNGASPSQATPVDGFILGTILQNVKGDRKGFIFTK